MKRTSAELKQIARENLRGHYGLPIGAMVVTELIVFAFLMPFSIIMNFHHTVSNTIIYGIASIIINLLTVVLSAGLFRIHLRLARKNAAPTFGDLFYGFTKRPDRFILSMLLLFLATFICMLPGVICFIIFEITFVPTMFFLMLLLLIGATVLMVIIELHFALVIILLIDNDSMHVIDAFRTSARLMKGNKGRLFYIELSFIGWTLLCALSCYIGYLWIAPYMSQTIVTFYRDVIGELDESNHSTGI